MTEYMKRLLAVLADLERELANIQMVKRGGMVPAHWPNRTGPVIKPEWEDVWSEIRRRKIEASAESTAAAAEEAGVDARDVRAADDEGRTRSGDTRHPALARGR